MLAHSQNVNGQVHPLVSHLLETAALARTFASEFNAGELAYYAGLWHDVGKFSSEFQAYLAQQGGRRSPDHKTAGAVLAGEKCDLLAFTTAGHHGGLPCKPDLEERLRSRNKTKLVEHAINKARAALPHLVPPGPLLDAFPIFLKDPQVSDVEAQRRAEFFIRMLFSALVDADYLDTERHFSPEQPSARSGAPQLGDLWQRFQDDQQRLSGKGQDILSRIRHEVYLRCLEAASQPPGIFRLTVPTGGGKTRSAMAFALKHALAHNMRRVIVAIPYTSIVEQTSRACRDIFGLEAVLEHHIEADWRNNEDDEAPSSYQTWARLASENWDAPIVVTTNVQLFESLFANRPARCRKIHNVAASVIILDEVQTLPPGLLHPILDVLRELVEHYRVSVVLCSATLPAFEGEVGSYALRGVWDIVPNAAKHFQALKRVCYELPKPDEKWSWSRVAQEMRSQERCMAVVNTKGDALALLDALHDPDALHLSTFLCGAHRRHVLEEVRRRLDEKRPCRLVTTQVVEAGVDLDFPMVLRAMGPLDRIVQAAGRCNREGQMPKPGCVIVFCPETGKLPQGEYVSGTQITEGLLRYATPDALFDPALYRIYFERLFPTTSLDREEIQEYRRQFNFPEVAKRFRLIKEVTVPAVVRYWPEPERIEELLAKARSETEEPRKLFRQLQPYVVSVRYHELARLEGMGLLQEVRPSLWEWRGRYDPVRGVGVPQAGMDPRLLVV